MLETKVKALLPQREPFLFVHQLLQVNKDEITGTMTYDESFPYYLRSQSQQRIVPGVILLESIIQCGGAGVTQAGITRKILWGLASVEKTVFSDVVLPNTTVKMVVKNCKVSNKILKQAGVSYCGEKAILEATWICLPFS